MLMSFAWSVTLPLNVVGWTVWALAAGWWHRRTPLDALRSDGPVLQLRPFEQGGIWYERRLRIKAWKDRLPETGGRFGGLSKRQLPGYSTVDLERFCMECRRGERTHWTVVAGAPFFILWNTRDVFLLMAGASAAGNSPFLAVLRYNRARIDSILQRNTKPGCPPSAMPRLAR